jgi:hypothetical protein
LNEDPCAHTFFALITALSTVGSTTANASLFSEMWGTTVAYRLVETFQPNLNELSASLGFDHMWSTEDTKSLKHPSALTWQRAVAIGEAKGVDPMYLVAGDILGRYTDVQALEDAFEDESEAVRHLVLKAWAIRKTQEPRGSFCDVELGFMSDEDIKGHMQRIGQDMAKLAQQVADREYLRQNRRSRVRP